MSVSFIRHQTGLPDMVLSSDVYFNDLRRRVQSIIGQVESICYTYEHGKDKSCWNEYTFSQFQAIRRNMLDLADEVGDIEENMVFNDEDREERAQTEEMARKTDSIISSILRRRGKE